MNKAFLTIVPFIVLIATVTVAIFGFTLMSEPGHMMAGCLGTTPGAACSTRGPIEHFEMHLSTFQSISTGIAKAFAAFAALAFVVALFLFTRRTEDGQKESFYVSRAHDVFPPTRTPLIHWLALHEKRDPSFAFAVNR